MKLFKKHLLSATGTQTTKGTEEHGSPERVKGGKLTNYFRSKQMAQITYRGVKYNAEQYKEAILAETVSYTHLRAHET